MPIMPRLTLCAALMLSLAACYSAPPLPPRAGGQITGAARIISPASPLQCVPFTRAATGIEIRGDAWTWWRSAASRYLRHEAPAIGSVLVLSKTSRLRLGHLAVVTRIVDDRVIVVDHANWLNRGQIHKGTPVRDVSAGNDWSAVRVWYTPGGVWGRTVYPVQGFISPRPAA
jgi:hypothetical protein